MSVQDRHVGGDRVGKLHRVPYPEILKCQYAGQRAVDHGGFKVGFASQDFEFSSGQCIDPFVPSHDDDGMDGDVLIAGVPGKGHAAQGGERLGRARDYP